MPKPSRYPNHPVKVLRTLLGFSSAAAFGEFAGVPPETIRNFEQGRRNVSPRAALQIGIATGVNPNWLQSSRMAKTEPMDFLGDPITKESFEQFRGGLSYRQSLDPNEGDEADRINDYCEDVTELLRVAVRKGRFNQCRLFLLNCLSDAQKSFGLRNLLDKEKTSELDQRFKPGVRFGKSKSLDWSDFYAAVRLLSRTAQFRWNEELATTKANASRLLDEIDNLRDVVAASFDVKPLRSKQSSRRVQRRARA